MVSGIAWLVKVVAVLQLCSPTATATVYLSLTSTNSSVGVLSNYSLAFNRSRNALGQTIAPSNLEASYIMTLTFDSAYPLTNSTTFQPAPSSLGANSATLALTQPTTLVTVNNIQNPLPSQIPLVISISFYNASNPSVPVDSCSGSLTFQILSFAGSALSYLLEPGNVSSTSNLTLTITPFLWDSSKMVLNLHMLTYWSRNLLNVTANQVLGTMSYCSPTCTITNRGGFFVVETTALALITGKLTLKIVNILSPATLEMADSLSVSLIESVYGSDVQAGTMAITSTYPNNLQVLTPATSSLVGQSISLSLTLTSQDLFSGSDSIVLALSTTLSMAAVVAISNPLVSSFSSQVQQSFRVTLSGFSLVTSIPSQFSGTITVNNISAQPSAQPITGNSLSFYRSGALYDQSIFAFQALPAAISSFNLTLASTKANVATNLTTSLLLSVGLNSTDQLYLRVDQAIAVYNCSVLSCSGCSCAITPANSALGLYYSIIRVAGFPLAASSSALSLNLIILLSVKNPIASGYVVSAASTDSLNFTKETGSAAYPSISQSSIPSSVFSLSKSVEMVYQLSNFTMSLDFRNYSLVDGWLVVDFDSAVSMPDMSNPYCLVNGNNGQCNLSLSSGALRANVAIG
jgi:hypothetical protein